MSAIAAGMERVVEAITKTGYPMNDSLGPGLSEHEIRSRTAALPFDLPKEIIELYQWRNGQSPDYNVFLFRDQRFLPLDEALDAYRMMQTYFVPALGGVDVGVDLTGCFPFAGFEGASYVVPCRGQKLVQGCALPIISVFEGIEAHFLSFATMMDTIVSWYEKGALRPDDPSVDSALELSIWKQFNPGLFE